MKPSKKLASLFTRASRSKKFDLFLDDLLTKAEIADLMQRWELISLLKKGVSQREIKKRLGISIAKVTRGSHALKKSKGGFAVVK